jgi:ABC-2 type transport system permease protein
MGTWVHEARHALRAPGSLAALVALLVLSAVAVTSGVIEIHRQEARIAGIAAHQAEDVGAISRWVSREGDAGNAAYYTFHPTWDPPSDLAFAALGVRDIAPYILRVRALGLEAQLYEGEVTNPEIAQPGRFDFAFVAVYLAPLFVILLLHDLFSGEREAGRLAALQVAASRPADLWRARVGVRGLALFLALIAPFLVGAAVSGTMPLRTFTVVVFVGAYLAVWISLATSVARLVRATTTAAMALCAIWLVVAVISPALAHLAINRAVPVRQGQELSIIHRDAVHRAWDIPKAATMDPFFRSHPEWASTAPVTTPFHWKWYFAFHQVADESVADLARSYDAGVLKRVTLSEGVGHVLPGAGLQLALHRLAASDPRAQLDYRQDIRDFHAQLRRYYYPYIFNERPFREPEFEAAPSFAPTPRNPPPPLSQLLALLALAGLMIAIIGRLRPQY